MLDVIASTWAAHIAEFLFSVNPEAIASRYKKSTF
tara:strand:- start:435 stop:539 length:105 start_codon:yes stop_codon:yes gene_type:complete